MKRIKNNFPGLVSPTSPAGSLGKVPTVSGSQLANPAAGSLKAPALSGTRSQSLSAKTVSTGINFGKGPRATTPTSSGFSWTSFLESTVSGGVISAITGSNSSGILGNLGGIGTLVSGLESLFGGGGKTLAPLVHFQLPAAQNETISVGANGSSGATVTTQSIQQQSTQIAQAVKTALLQSSSLNDILAEI